MPKLYVRPSGRPDKYPNGGDEGYWMSLIAHKLEEKLEAWEIACVLDETETPVPEDCGLCLYLCSHAAPEEIEAKIKGAEVCWYEYSPSGKKAAERFAAAIREIYPEPELVDTAHTAAREELSKVKLPALLIKLGYHDNPQDEAWLVNHVEEIAEALARAAADFLEVEPL